MTSKYLLEIGSQFTSIKYIVSENIIIIQMSSIHPISFQKIQEIDIPLLIFHSVAGLGIVLVSISLYSLNILSDKCMCSFLQYLRTAILFFTGQKFAMMELKIVLATFFKHYEVKSLTKQEDMKVLLDAVIRPENGIWVQIYKRMRTNKNFQTVKKSLKNFKNHQFW